ncbi:MAG TPA: hypothetical protein H9867_08020, partial [Candidatus Corynebacterium gallistercoris]|nr:hypothetical protein [Candidatus Corynebacterium gallistercoris]
VLVATRMSGGAALGFYVVLVVTVVITVGARLLDVRGKSEVTDAGFAGRLARMKAEKAEEAELREGAGSGGVSGAGGVGAPWWKQVLLPEVARDSPRSPAPSYLLMTVPMRACGAWLLLVLAGSVLVFMVPWYFTGSEALVSKWFWAPVMASLSVPFLGGAALGETLRGWLVFSQMRREWLRKALAWNAAWVLMGPVVYLLGAAELGLLILVAPRASGPFSAWSWGSFLLGLAASVVVAGLLVMLAWWVFIISARLRGAWLWVAVVIGCMACGFMLGVPIAYLEEAGASEAQYLLAGCGLLLVLGVLTSALVVWQLKRVDLGSGFSEAMGLRAEV